MKESDYKFMEELLRRQSGLSLTPEKVYLLEARLPPVAAAHGLQGIEDLVSALRRSMQLERAVIEAMATHETSFFRDAAPYVQLRDVLLPYFVKARGGQKGLKIWSAACATGQEPYSIAMQIVESAAGLQADITATDLSHDVINRAREGVYSQFDVQRGLPARLLVKYFTRHEEKWQIRDDIRRMVHFRQMNLLSPAGLGLFDIVFCRNVLIYFGPAEREKVLATMAGAMKPDAVLCLGMAEMLPSLSRHFKPLAGQAGLYVRVDSNFIL